jgi:hypothetical protein
MKLQRNTARTFISDRRKGEEPSPDDVPATDDEPKPQVEYVKPMKMSPLPLHEQDLLYGDDQWEFTSAVTSDTAQPTERHHDISRRELPCS